MIFGTARAAPAGGPIRHGLAAAMALLLPGTAATAAALEIAVTEVHVAKGRIHVGICPEAAFVQRDCPYSAEAPAVRGTTVVTVPELPPGRYAAQVFHDRNANGIVDRGPFGVPIEPIGFSNDAPLHLGPPRFADAAFSHGRAAQRISLRLRGVP